MAARGCASRRCNADACNDFYVYSNGDHERFYRVFHVDEKGVTWCYANVEAVRALDAAVALGLEAPDEPF